MTKHTEKLIWLWLEPVVEFKHTLRPADREAKLSLMVGFDLVLTSILQYFDRQAHHLERDPEHMATHLTLKMPMTRLLLVKDLHNHFEGMNPNRDPATHLKTIYATPAQLEPVALELREASVTLNIDALDKADNSLTIEVAMYPDRHAFAQTLAVNLFAVETLLKKEWSYVTV